MGKRESQKEMVEIKTEEKKNSIFNYFICKIKDVNLYWHLFLKNL